ncbi:MAG: hypothetical protein RMM53_04120 [Bacteroidia bacterium]|nr:hypothetical protein [Bacteroidia bacterium]MDW8333383.1 hypothetical protein [Bacteroidia bacterium]
MFKILCVGSILCFATPLTLGAQGAPEPPQPVKAAHGQLDEIPRQALELLSRFFPGHKDDEWDRWDDGYQAVFVHEDVEKTLILSDKFGVLYKGVGIDDEDLPPAIMDYLTDFDDSAVIQFAFALEDPIKQKAYLLFVQRDDGETLTRLLFTEKGNFVAEKIVEQALDKDDDNDNKDDDLPDETDKKDDKDDDDLSDPNLDPQD